MPSANANASTIQNGEPSPIRLPRVLQARELRQQQVEAEDHRGQEAAQRQDAAAGELEAAIVVFLFVAGRAGLHRLLRRAAHDRALASSCCSVRLSRVAAGDTFGVATRMPSASASPAARSVT